MYARAITGNNVLAAIYATNHLPLPRHYTPMSKAENKPLADVFKALIWLTCADVDSCYTPYCPDILDINLKAWLDSVVTPQVMSIVTAGFEEHHGKH